MKAGKLLQLILVLFFCFTGCDINPQEKLASGVKLDSLIFQLDRKVKNYEKFSLTIDGVTAEAIGRSFLNASSFMEFKVESVSTPHLTYIAKFSDGTVSNNILVLRFFKNAVFANFALPAKNELADPGQVWIRLDEHLKPSEINRIRNHFLINEKPAYDWKTGNWNGQE